MKAAVVQKFGEPLVIEDRPVPEPGPGRITVHMQASGLCHTDIHAANGDWPVKPTPPFVPGHEGVGTVHAVDEGVTGVSAGEMVAVPWLGHACGTCKYCLTGWETLCLRQVGQRKWPGGHVRRAVRARTIMPRRVTTWPDTNRVPVRPG